MRLSRSAGSSFHYALKLFPSDQASALHVIYYFCRRVDDAVDQPRPRDQKKRLLDTLGKNLRGGGSGFLWNALDWVREAYAIPEDCFVDLLLGARTDLGPVCLETYAELETYCQRVAGSVGRMILHVAGADEPPAREAGRDMARAFQLTNILRDVREDHRRRRCYLPVAMLRKEGALRDWKAGRDSPRFRTVLKRLARRARRDYHRSLELLDRLPGRIRFPVAMMTATYSWYLAELDRHDYAVWDRTFSLPTRDLPKLFWASLGALVGPNERCLMV